MKAADLHFQQLEGCDHSPHYIIITILQIKRPESKKLEDFSQSWIWDSAAKEISQSALTQTLIIQNPYMQNCFSSNFEHHRNTSALIIPAIDVYQSISSASPDVKELSVARLEGTTFLLIQDTCTRPLWLAPPNTNTICLFHIPLRHLPLMAQIVTAFSCFRIQQIFFMSYAISKGFVSPSGCLLGMFHLLGKCVNYYTMKPQNKK